MQDVLRSFKDRVPGLTGLYCRHHLWGWAARVRTLYLGPKSRFEAQDSCARPAIVNHCRDALQLFMAMASGILIRHSRVRERARDGTRFERTCLKKVAEGRCCLGPADCSAEAHNTYPVSS